MPHQAMLFCLLGNETFQKAIAVLRKCLSQSKHILPMRQKEVRDLPYSAGEGVPVLAEVPLTS